MPNVPKPPLAILPPGSINSEPMRTIVESLIAMSHKAAEYTMKGKILTLVVNTDLGRRLGIAPGEAARIMTAVGPVGIYCEFD